MDQRRETDLVAHLGGDEFVILLDDTSAEIAQGIAEKIRSTLQGFSIPGVGSTGGCQHRLCELPANASSANELLNKAERAMYHAKK